MMYRHFLSKHYSISDIISETHIYDFICKKRSEGFDYKKACIAGLNKFLRMYYGSVMSMNE